MLDDKLKQLLNPSDGKRFPGEAAQLEAIEEARRAAARAGLRARPLARSDIKDAGPRFNGRLQIRVAGLRPGRGDEEAGVPVLLDLAAPLIEPQDLHDHLLARLQRSGAPTDSWVATTIANLTAWMPVGARAQRGDITEPLRERWPQLAERFDEMQRIASACENAVTHHGQFAPPGETTGGYAELVADALKWGAAQEDATRRADWRDAVGESEDLDEIAAAARAAWGPTPTTVGRVHEIAADDTATDRNVVGMLGAMPLLLGNTAGWPIGAIAPASLTAALLSFIRRQAGDGSAQGGDPEAATAAARILRALGPVGQGGFEPTIEAVRRAGFTGAAQLVRAARTRSRRLEREWSTTGTYVVNLQGPADWNALLPAGTLGEKT